MAEITVGRNCRDLIVLTAGGTHGIAFDGTSLWVSGTDSYCTRIDACRPAYRASASLQHHPSGPCPVIGGGATTRGVETSLTSMKMYARVRTLEQALAMLA